MGQRTDAAAEIVEGEVIPCSRKRHMKGAMVPRCALAASSGNSKPRVPGSMRLLRTSSSSIRQNSPSASEAADRFSENFAGCWRS